MKLSFLIQLLLLIILIIGLYLIFNNGVSGRSKLILIVFLVVIGIYLFNKLPFLRGYNEVIENPVSAETTYNIPSSDLKKSNGDFSISSWIYINDWNTKYGQNKTILKMGDNLIKMKLGKYENNLKIILSAYDENESDYKSNMFSSAIEYGFNSDIISQEYLECDNGNIFYNAPQGVSDPNYGYLLKTGPVVHFDAADKGGVDGDEDEVEGVVGGHEDGGEGVDGGIVGAAGGVAAGAFGAVKGAAFDAVKGAVPIVNAAVKGAVPIANAAVKGAVPIANAAVKGATPIANAAVKGATPIANAAVKGAVKASANAKDSAKRFGKRAGRVGSGFYNRVIKKREGMEGGNSKISCDNTSNVEIEIENINLQKWVNIIIAVNDRVLDVYINGKLVSSKAFNNVINTSEINTSDLVITPNGGYGGFISKVQYYPVFITPKKAWEIYRNSFGDAFASALDKYNLSVTFYEDQIEKKKFWVF